MIAMHSSSTLWGELFPTVSEGTSEVTHSVETRCRYGDLWQCGNHRILCGDSTNPQDVARLMQDEKSVLVMADPPYGMGKQKDGVFNDNLYGKKLDTFQMQWWRACRSRLSDNASAYIWGTAEDLWRLWYTYLKHSERFTIRNEIVWAKGSAGAGGISHMGIKGLRLYPQETERCLFFMLGEQEMSTNADNYWEGWEPIRAYLEQERLRMGWDVPAMKRAVGHSDLSGDHWTSKSQWNFPSYDVYKKLQQAARGQAFQREYDELKREYDAARSYFDNTHENMTDVWHYPRVTGSERYGHPTPKPVKMLERIFKTSARANDLVYDPFAGSGTAIVSAEMTGRRCYSMEIHEPYVDTVLQRWEQLTGRQAIRVEVFT